MSEETQVEEAEAPAVEQDPNALQATDLNTMATILEAVAQRGAIRASEMAVVGSLYNKLMGFLIANGIRPAPGAEEPVEGEEEVETGEADNA